MISIAKTTSKKSGALMYSMKFLSLEVAFYLCKSTIWPDMDYCCHVYQYYWAGAPSCYLELLDKLQKWYTGLLVLDLLPLEPLADCQNLASLSLFYWCYFGRCLSELVQLAPLPYS